MCTTGIRTQATSCSRGQERNLILVLHNLIGLVSDVVGNDDIPQHCGQSANTPNSWVGMERGKARGSGGVGEAVRGGWFRFRAGTVRDKYHSEGDWGESVWVRKGGEMGCTWPIAGSGSV